MDPQPGKPCKFTFKVAAVRMDDERPAEAGFMSRIRWGPGAIATAILIAAAAVAALIIGRFRATSIAVAAVIFAMLLIYVLVKRAERIVPASSGWATASLFRARIPRGPWLRIRAREPGK